MALGSAVECSIRDVRSRARPVTTARAHQTSCARAVVAVAACESAGGTKRHSDVVRFVLTAGAAGAAPVRPVRAGPAPFVTTCHAGPLGTAGMHRDAGDAARTRVPASSAAAAHGPPAEVNLAGQDPISTGLAHLEHHHGPCQPAAKAARTARPGRSAIAQYAMVLVRARMELTQ